MVQPKSTRFAILGNFFICRGESGLVLEVKARYRTGPKNFITCMREGVQRRYPGQPVGIGGVFAVETGKLKMHVMVNNQSFFVLHTGHIFCIARGISARFPERPAEQS